MFASRITSSNGQKAFCLAWALLAHPLALGCYAWLLLVWTAGMSLDIWFGVLLIAAALLSVLRAIQIYRRGYLRFYCLVSELGISGPNHDDPETPEFQWCDLTHIDGIYRPDDPVDAFARRGAWVLAGLDTVLELHFRDKGSLAVPIWGVPAPHIATYLKPFVQFSHAHTSLLAWTAMPLNNNMQLFFRAEPQGRMAIWVWLFVLLVFLFVVVWPFYAVWLESSW